MNEYVERIFIYEVKKWYPFSLLCVCLNNKHLFLFYLHGRCLKEKYWKLINTVFLIIISTYPSIMMHIGHIVLCVFFSLTVMKQDSKSNRQRDEGKEENSYEDNRAHFYSLHKIVGQQEVEHGHLFVLATSGDTPCLALIMLVL